MGLFDTITVGELEGQVKLWWNEMHKFGIGDRVPAVRGHLFYDIAMRDRGYVHVRNGRIAGWTNKSIYPNIFDKWGDPFDPSNPPERYYFD